MEKIIDAIYPARCPICGQIKREKNAYTCKTCIEKLSWIQEPKCKKCGKMIANEGQEYCLDCSRLQYHFETGYPLWNYNEVIQKSIADFKYAGRREYGEFYGEALAIRYGAEFSKLELDAIIPVPIHRTKRRERGYNQTEIISDILGEKLNLPVWKDFLIRNRKTMPQKELSQRERLKNLEEAFSVKDQKNFINGANVMLVDDIYTSGSTMEACAKILLKAGIEKVYVTMLCIGKGYEGNMGNGGNYYGS